VGTKSGKKTLPLDVQLCKHPQQPSPSLKQNINNMYQYNNRRNPTSGSSSSLGPVIGDHSSERTSFYRQLPHQLQFGFSVSGKSVIKYSPNRRSPILLTKKYEPVNSNHTSHAKLGHVSDVMLKVGATSPHQFKSFLLINWI
jgi:hypothetical protein